MESVAAEASTPPKKPALLRGGMVVCWIYAAVLALLVAVVPTLERLSADGAQTDVRLPGLPSSREISAGALAATRMFVIPLLVLSIIVAYGLAKDRHWSRRAMMLLLVLGIVLVPPQFASPVDYAVSAAFAVFGWWYLYRKPNVVGYYDAIRATPGAG